MPDSAFKRFGKYEIQDELGRGGFGRVFRAFDPTVGRLVAIKILVSEAGTDLLSRFKNEATAAGKLRHENIVTIYEFGEEKGVPYIAMEYLEGEDLQQTIASRRALTLLEKVTIMGQTAAGLECAHRNGVVHRDVKPANIRLLPDGSVKIMDFGIARLIREDGAARLTRRGHVMGTLLYMAPEQVMGSDTDSLCDIFAFGVIFYELLTGSHPFRAEDPRSIFYKITSEEPEMVHQLVPDCPETLDQVIRRALQKDRELRYQSLRDLRLDIEPVLIELRRDRAASLITSAHQLTDDRNFESACDLLNEAIDLDPGNQSARKLRDHVQLQIRQQLLRPRIEALLTKASQSADQGNYADALQMLSSALRLSPDDPALQDRIREAETQRDQSRECARLLTEARTDLAHGDLGVALQKASDAARLNHLNVDAQSLIEIIRRAIDKRERERLLALRVSKARELLLSDELDAALGILNLLESDQIQTAVAVELLSRIAARKAELEREQQLERELRAAQELREKSDLVGAIEQLKQLQTSFPGETRVTDVLAETQREFEALRAAQAIETALQQSKALANRKHFDEAIAVLEEAGGRHPESAVLKQHRERLVSERDAFYRAQATERALQEADRLVSEGLLEQSVSLLESAFTAGSDDRVDAAIARAQELIKERDSRAEIQRVCAAVRHSLEGNRFEEALASLEHACAELGHDEAVLHMRTEIIAAKDAWTREQERVAAIRELIDRANSLREAGNPAAALQLLQVARLEFPNEGDIANGIEAAERALSTLGMQEAISQVRPELEQLLTSNQFAQANRLLQNLWRDWPDAPEMAALRQDIEAKEAAWRREQEREAAEAELARRSEERRSCIERCLGQCNALIQAGKLVDAVRNLQETFRQYPDAQELAGLQERIQSEWALRRRAEATRRAVDNARSLLEQGQARRAIQLLEAAAAQYPQEPLIEGALEAAKLAQQETRKSTLVESVCQETRLFLKSRDFDQALRTVESNLATLGSEPKLVAMRETVLATQRSFELTNSRNANPLPSKPDRPSLLRRYAAPVVGGLVAVLVVFAALEWQHRGAATASLHVETEPRDATVRVDGRSCAPDCRVALTAGRHAVEASAVGYSPASKSLLIGAERQVQLQLSLLPLPTALRITSNFAGGVVKLDTRTIGRLTDGQFSLAAVDPGKHVLSVEGADGQISQSFRVTPARLPELDGKMITRDTKAIVVTSMGSHIEAVCFDCAGPLQLDGGPVNPKLIRPGRHELMESGADKPLRTALDMQEAPAITIHLRSNAASAEMLQIEANVDGASVYIDGRKLSQETQGGRLAVALKPRQYSVMVQKSGYNVAPGMAKVNISAGDQARVSFRLEPKPATIGLPGLYEGAVLVIDGRAMGTVGKNGIQVAVTPGSHLVALTQLGFKPTSTQVSVGPGEAASLNAASLHREAIVQPVKQSQELQPAPLAKPPQPTPEELEATDWASARSAKSNAASLHSFLEKYPNSAHRAEALQLLAEVDWSSVDRNDRAALDRYARQHPGTLLAQQAIVESKRIESEAAASTAKKMEDQTVTAREEIVKLFATYSSAFEAKDLALLRRVWPAMPERALGQTFRAKGVIHSQLQPIAAIQVSGDQASVSCMRITEQSTPFGRQRPVRETRMVRLHREAGHWVISAIE